MGSSVACDFDMKQLPLQSRQGITLVFKPSETTFGWRSIPAYTKLQVMKVLQLRAYLLSLHFSAARTNSIRSGDMYKGMLHPTTPVSDGFDTILRLYKVWRAISFMSKSVATLKRARNHEI